MQLAEPMAVAAAVRTQVVARESMVLMRLAAVAVPVGVAERSAKRLVTADPELLLFVIQSLLHLRT
jgi:hypothetical protein